MFEVCMRHMYDRSTREMAKCITQSCMCMDVPEAEHKAPQASLTIATIACIQGSIIDVQASNTKIVYCTRWC